MQTKVMIVSSSAQLHLSASSILWADVRFHARLGDKENQGSEISKNKMYWGFRGLVQTIESSESLSETRTDHHQIFKFAYLHTKSHLPGTENRNDNSRNGMAIEILMISCLQIKSPIEQAQLRRDISESRR
jgi:hypothetical protein